MFIFIFWNEIDHETLSQQVEDLKTRHLKMQRKLDEAERKLRMEEEKRIASERTSAALQAEW